MNNLQDIIPQSFHQYLDENQFRLQWMMTSESHVIAHLLDQTDDNIFIQFSISSTPSDMNERLYDATKKNLFKNGLNSQVDIELLIGSRLHKVFLKLIDGLSWNPQYPLQILESNSYKKEYIGKLYCNEFFCLNMTNKLNYKNSQYISDSAKEYLE